MQRRLPTWFASAGHEPDLALADARHLVARSVGFDDWLALTRSLGAPPAARPSAREPQPYRFDAATNTINVSGRLAEAHWDAVIAAMKERVITGAIAPGMTDAVLKRVSRVDGLRHLSIGGAVTDAGIRHLEIAALRCSSVSRRSSMCAATSRGWTSWRPRPCPRISCSTARSRIAGSPRSSVSTAWSA